MTTHRGAGTGAACGAAGHTLLELLVALAIVAAVATLATAGYGHFTRAARRFEARSALASLAAAQERHYLRHARYAAVFAADAPFDDGTPVGADALAWSPDAATSHYALAIAAAGDDSYRLEARPRGSQARDRDCAVFVLDASGARAAHSASGTDTTRRCWGGA